MYFFSSFSQIMFTGKICGSSWIYFWAPQEIFYIEIMICVLQNDWSSQHSIRQTRSTSCSNSCVSTLGLVWNYGVTAQSTRWRSHGCELLHGSGQQCVAARFVKASSDWLFPLAPHPDHPAGQHFGLRCRHKVSPPALKSHQLLCYIAGYFRLAGGHFGDAMESGHWDRRVLAIRRLLRCLGGLWHHVFHRLHLESVRHQCGPLLGHF